MTTYYEDDTPDPNEFWNEAEKESPVDFDDYDFEKLNTDNLSVAQVRQLLSTGARSDDRAKWAKVSPVLKKMIDTLDDRRLSQLAAREREAAEDEFGGQPVADKDWARREAAHNRAMRLAGEFGLSATAEAAAFKRLLPLADLPAMEREFHLMRSEVAERRSGKDPEAREPQRSSLVEAMASIDLSTASGRQQWEEQRGRFRKALGHGR